MGVVKGRQDVTAARLEACQACFGLIPEVVHLGTAKSGRGKAPSVMANSMKSTFLDLTLKLHY